MNLLTIALYAAATLTILSLLLLLLIIVLRLVTERRARGEAAFRRQAGAFVTEYLAGSEILDETSMELKKDPGNALRLLMGLYETVDERGRERLHRLIASVPFVRHELEALRGRDWERRLHAAEHLGYLGDDQVIPDLMHALRDEMLPVRMAAAHSLARLGCTDAAEPILLALDVPGEVSQRRVAEVLHELGPGVASPILAVLDNPQNLESQLAIAIRVAGMLGTDRAVHRLQELLQHASPEIRLNSIRSLASIGDRTAVPAIAALATDPEWEVRNAAVQALGRLRATEHHPLLLEALADRSWWVRYSAAKALWESGPGGVDALNNAAEHHVDAFARDVSRQVLQEHGFLQAPTETHP